MNKFISVKRNKYVFKFEYFLNSKNVKIIS